MGGDDLVHLGAEVLGVDGVVDLLGLHLGLFGPLVDLVVGVVAAQLLTVGGETENDVIAELALHRLAHLAGLEGQRSGLKLLHHLAAGSHIFRRGKGAVLVAAVVAALVHGFVKGGFQVVRGPELGHQSVGLLQDGLLVGLGQVVAVGVLGGEQDVLDAVQAVLIGKGGNGVGAGVQRTALIEGLVEVLAQIVFFIHGQEAVTGHTLGVQHHLKGDVLLGQRALHVGQLLLGGGLILIGEGDAVFLGLLGDDGVVGDGGQGVGLHIIGGGLIFDLLGGPVLAGEIAIVLDIGDALLEPEQIVLGGDLLAVDGGDHGVAGNAGGLVGNIVRSGLLGTAGQHAHQQRGTQGAAQQFLCHIHLVETLLSISGEQYNRLREKIQGKVSPEPGDG